MGKRARRRARNKTTESKPKTTPAESTRAKLVETGFDWVYAGVLTCFVLSGFAALLYQTTWLRQFSIAFGTSELAVATVLAAYMGGLALGASIAARYLHLIVRPVLAYCLLEAGIAITALAVPWALVAATSLYTNLLGGQALPPDAASNSQALFYLFSGFVILALPTAFMGATLPLLMRHAVQSNEQLGKRVATLYASNTFGAVLGTLTAAFVLLPRVGLNTTVWVGVGVNLLVFIIAVMLAGKLKPLKRQANIAAIESSHMAFFHCCVLPWFFAKKKFQEKFNLVFTRQPAWILPVMLVSGANAFLYEVLWTRLLNHVLGGSIYAFATMLASFLSGIAIGAVLAGHFARSRDQAVMAFALVQFAIGVCSLAVYSWLEHLLPGTRNLFFDAIFSALVMLPSTIFIGATFPLAVRMLARDEHDAGHGSARVYAWNTVGAIVGAILAGFYLVPLLGFEGAIRLAFITNLILCLWALVVIANRQILVISVLVLITLGAVFFYHPQRPQAVLNASRFDQQDKEPRHRELFFAVGRSATVLMTEQDGWINLRSNGLGEALIDPKGTPPSLQNQRWLAALPAAARPDANSMLIIGFGGGMALQGAPQSVRELDVIELEPEVIEANRAIASIRARDPLADPRVKIIINDARNALRLSSKQYDIIVSQPSHPWTAGASHLYTREFMSLAKQHLPDEGVFVQWINTEFLTESLLRSLAATLLDVYKHVRVYQPEPGALFFLASDAELNIEQQIASSGRPLDTQQGHYALLGLNSLEDFVAALAMDEKGMRDFARGATLSTDDFNLMATRSRSLGDGLKLDEVSALFAPHDPLLDRDSWVYRQLPAETDQAYIGLRLLHRGFSLRADFLAKTLPERSNALLLRAAILSHHGRRNEALEYLRAAIHERPDNRQAGFAMLKNQLASVVSGKAGEELEALARNLQGSPRAVIDGWKYAAQQDWLKLVQLEEQLAESKPTESWYPEASQLRAEWRTRLKAEGLQRNLPREALDIIDRSLLIAPELDLYVLRALCGLLLKDAYVYLESSRFVSKYIELKLDLAKSGDYLLTPEERALMLTRLQELGKKLESELVKPVKGRAHELRLEMKELARDLKQFTPSA